jgi:hypothetical protein
MATITNGPSLSFSVLNNGQTVQLRISYTVRFTLLESHLAPDGLGFKEIIEIKSGEAPSGVPRILRVVDHDITSLIRHREHDRARRTVPVDRVVTVPRSELQVDPGGSDEIFCKVILDPIGEPRQDSGNTNRVSIAG